MIINQSGITLRLPVDGIRVMGRATQGVKLIDLAKRGDKIASVCKVDSDPEEEIEEEIEQDQQKIVINKDMSAFDGTIPGLVSDTIEHEADQQDADTTEE